MKQTWKMSVTRRWNREEEKCPPLRFRLDIGRVLIYVCVLYPPTDCSGYTRQDTVRWLLAWLHRSLYIQQTLSSWKLKSTLFQTEGIFSKPLTAKEAEEQEWKHKNICTFTRGSNHFLVTLLFKFCRRTLNKSVKRCRYKIPQQYAR